MSPNAYILLVLVTRRYGDLVQILQGCLRKRCGVLEYFQYFQKYGRRGRLLGDHRVLLILAAAVSDTCQVFAKLITKVGQHLQRPVRVLDGDLAQLLRYEGLRPHTDFHQVVHNIVSLQQSIS